MRTEWTGVSERRRPAVSRLLQLIGLAILAVVLGCSDYRAEGSGSARIGVSAQALSTADIARVEVTVNGDDIDPDIVADLEASGGSWQGVIQDIPAGEDRTFTARAYDASDALLYQGRATGVSILEGQTVIVEIFLEQVEPPTPFENAVPRFTSLVASANQVAPGQPVTLTVAATDPNPEDTLAFAWSADGGSFDDSSATSVVWTAPATVGMYELTVSATDPAGATATLSLTIDVQTEHGSGNADVRLGINTWPEVAGLVPSPTRIDVGESTALDLDVSDPDGDAMIYSWSASCDGSFDDASAEDPTFTLDSDHGGADCSLTASITDGRGGSNTATVAIQTGPGIAPTCVGPDCAEDTAPPVLEAFSFTPTTIDTTEAEATVTVSATISDDLSGFSYGYVYFVSPGGDQQRSCSFHTSSGNPTSFSGTCDAPFPQYGEGGVWSVYYLYARDAVGNYLYLETADLDAAGFPTELTVLSAQDTSSPVLEAFSFAPTTIDTTEAEATVTVSATISDDLSGFSYGYVYFVSPGGDQQRSCSFHPSSGNPTSFSGTCDAPFPQYGEGGVWSVYYLYARDAVGNYLYLETADLEAAGFPYLLNVNSAP